MERKLNIFKGHTYIESKPRARLNKCFMSLYCTNIDVYFDNKAVYNSKCVEGHYMHNDNDSLWHQEFVLRESASGEAVFFTKRLVGVQNSISHPALTGCTLHFSRYRGGFEVICLICQWLCAVAGVCTGFL